MEILKGANDVFNKGVDVVQTGAEAITKSEALQSTMSAVQKVVSAALLISAVPQRVNESSSLAEVEEVFSDTTSTVVDNLGDAMKDVGIDVDAIKNSQTLSSAFESLQSARMGAGEVAQHVRGGLQNTLQSLMERAGFDDLQG